MRFAVFTGVGQTPFENPKQPFPVTFSQPDSLFALIEATLC